MSAAPDLVTPLDFFTAGGPLRPDAPSYVKRPADDELFSRVLASEFCYVLTARQMGKSSLMIRTARRLQVAGVSTVIIDLTQIGTVTIDQWYLGLLAQLEKRLKLSVDTVAWWQGRSAIGQVQRFNEFLRDVVLVEVSNRIAIFIDEIDSTLKLDFRDDFFAAIRAIYNARAEDSEFERLTFVLLGVASPADLILDRARTPFNIGQEIPLRQFGQDDAEPLKHGLEAAYLGQGEAIFRRVFYWTGGHPYLTQKLCQSIVEGRYTQCDNTQIDRLVRALFLSENARRETNLQFVRDNILNHPQRREMLAVYAQVYRGRRILDNKQSSAQSQLKLSGLVTVDTDYLRVNNTIYRQVFNLAWIQRNTAINWTPIAAGIATTVVFLATGYLIFSYWVNSQADAAFRRYSRSGSPREQMAELARLFRLPTLPGGIDYDSQARELFYSLDSSEAQQALFNTYSRSNPDDVLVVAKGLYTTLADTDETGKTGLLLKAIYDVLEEGDLKKEIGQWLEARQLTTELSLENATTQYNAALQLNPQNPATLYERARILARMGRYSDALSDLDRVIGIAQALVAPATTTPEPSATFTEAPPTATRLPTSRPTLIPTSAPQLTATAVTPKSTAALTSTTLPTEPLPPTESPAHEPINPEFSTTTEIIRAVRNLIQDNLELFSILAQTTPSQYPNLADFGLIATLTPTPPPQTPPPTITFSSPVLATESVTPVTPTPILILTPTITHTPIGERLDQIAFHSNQDGNFEIYVMNVDGSDVRRITDNTVSDTSPAWSPDGTKLAFVSRRDGNSEIYVMNANGSVQTRLTTSPELDFSPAWSPDGSKIAFSSARDGNGEIYIMNVDGSEQTRLTDDFGDDFDPVWSPDGKRLAFVSNRLSSSDIYVMNADGSQQARLTDASGNYPAWSPDGTRLLFTAKRGQKVELFVLSLSTLRQTQLTLFPAHAASPIWSPDGTYIIFVSDQATDVAVSDVEQNELYLMNADGTGVKRLTENTFNDGGPAWSP